MHNIVKSGKNVSVGAGCRKYVACEGFIKMMFNEFDKNIIKYILIEIKKYNV